MERVGFASDDVSFEFEREPPKLAPDRKRAAEEYVRRALAEASPKAIRFMARLVDEAEISDDLKMKRLGLLAADSILDRFLGKATQELRVGEARERPIVFSEKLAALGHGIDAALKARDGRPLEAFEEAVTAPMADDAGVRIG